MRFVSFVRHGQINKYINKWDKKRDAPFLGFPSILSIVSCRGRNTVKALDGVLCHVTKPGGGAVVGGAKYLDTWGPRHNSIKSPHALDFGANHLPLKGISSKKIQGLFLDEHEAFKFLLDNFGHFRLHHLVGQSASMSASLPMQQS
jgi:hypothetical protein